MAPNAFYAATGFLLRNAGQLDRKTALENCANFVMEQYCVSQPTAEKVAIQALAELESFNQKAWIDAEASTAHVVIVRRPEGNPLAFTVNDLVRLHDQAQFGRLTREAH